MGIYDLCAGQGDRTREIAELLQGCGVCRLGPGEFIVAGLEMPENTLLSGCGNATQILLAEEVTDGFAVRLQTGCTVRDLKLLGSRAPIELPEEPGTRHGLVWYGNYSVDKTDRPERGTVENVSVCGFTGGALTQNNTGYAIETGLNVSDCWFWNCGVGINIAFWSEFSRYTNVQAARCTYGCINNGGNNMFVNCCFSGDKVGFLIDNLTVNAKNNSHGSMVGCTINHSDNNLGVGIRLLNVSHGYVFSGCQIFYSAIEIQNSQGVVFSDINFGKDEHISVTGGKVTVFRGCMFCTSPQISAEAGRTRFTDCITRDGEPVGD